MQRSRVLVTLMLCGAGAVSAHAQAAPAAPAVPTPQVQLWEAAVTGDTAALRSAAVAGAKVDSLDTGRSRNGRRALNYAALNNRVTAIRWLLTAGAQIEAANITGFTALHHAAEAGMVEAARALLEAGADPTHTNALGLTPAQVAANLGNDQLAAILAEAARTWQPRRP